MLLSTLVDSGYKQSGLIKFQKYKPRIVSENRSDIFKDQVTINTQIDLISALESYLNTNTISIKNILDLYVNHNVMVSESVIVDINVIEVNEYREYNRDRHIWCSKRTPNQFDELHEDIKQEGIQQPGRIRVNHSNGAITAILGEGNHRLSIAKKLKLKTMPIVFRFISDK
jgi:hypothetical protein